MSLHFEIDFADLTLEKQEEIAKSVYDYLMEDIKEEGEKLLNDKWHVKPKTWEEAYCRYHAIDCQYWNDLDENSKEFQEFDWKYALESHVQEYSEEQCYQSMRYTEIEVEV